MRQQFGSTLGREAERLRADEGAHLVVEAAGHRDVAAQKLEGVREGDGVADSNATLRFLAALGADVNPLLVKVQHLLALLRLHQMNRLLAHHAEDGTIPRCGYAPSVR